MNVSYFLQATIVAALYITILTICSYYDPSSEVLRCDANYNCTVTQRIIFNYHVEGNFIIAKESKLHFYKSFSGNSYSVDINNYEPFRGSISASNQEIEKILKDYENYQKNPSVGFVLQTNRRNHAMVTIGSIITIFIMILLLTENPLKIIGNFIRIILTSGRY